VLSDILSRGRASRLYKKMVKEKKIALQASGFPGFPGSKYPNLMIFLAVPTQGHTTDECETAIYEEIERLKNEPVTADELKKAKTRARADLIRQFGSNSGIAGQLTFYQTVTGDWRNLFRSLDQINAVTAEDVQRVAKQYLIAKHRTVGVIKAPSSL
jgi:predicted Zn-dependent peptidase